MFNQTKRRAGQPSVITATPCAPPALSAIYSKDLHTNRIEHPTVQSSLVKLNFTRCPATWQHHLRQVTQHVPWRRRRDVVAAAAAAPSCAGDRRKPGAGGGGHPHDHDPRVAAGG